MVEIQNERIIVENPLREAFRMFVRSPAGVAGFFLMLGWSS
jgi:hypothetical protein